MAGKWRWQAAQFAERKWWQNYLKKKNVINYLVWKKKYWQSLWEICLPYVSFQENTKILDAGCGPAGMYMLFPNHQISAFDPLLDAYEVDLPHFKRNMYPNVIFQNIGLEDFNNKETFDIIFCMNAINHVKNIESSYDTLVKCAHKSSSIIVTIDAHNSNFLKNIFKLLPGDILHPHQFNLKEYENMLTFRGCKISHIQLLKKEFFFSHYIMIAEKL
jgi:2-polyprenyl-6-hydroxyphenyl methylase/3-demethylubiquinone-9 3-methyltransferase